MIGCTYNHIYMSRHIIIHHISGICPHIIMAHIYGTNVPYPLYRILYIYIIIYTYNHIHTYITLYV